MIYHGLLKWWHCVWVRRLCRLWPRSLSTNKLQLRDIAWAKLKCHPLLGTVMIGWWNCSPQSLHGLTLSKELLGNNLATLAHVLRQLSTYKRRKYLPFNFLFWIVAPPPLICGGNPHNLLNSISELTFTSSRRPTTNCRIRPSVIPSSIDNYTFMKSKI